MNTRVSRRDHRMTQEKRKKRKGYSVDADMTIDVVNICPPLIEVSIDYYRRQKPPEPSIE